MNYLDDTEKTHLGINNGVLGSGIVFGNLKIRKIKNIFK